MENIIMIESLVAALVATKEVTIEYVDYDSYNQEEVRDLHVINLGNINIKEHKEMSYVLSTDEYPVEIELGYDELGRANLLQLFVGNRLMICTSIINTFNTADDIIDFLGKLIYQRLQPLSLGDFDIYFNKYKEGMITISRLCPICQDIHDINVSPSQFENWLRWYFAEPGYEHIQDALPELSAKEREVFITGIDDECFQSMYDSIDEE